MAATKHVVVHNKMPYQEKKSLLPHDAISFQLLQQSSSQTEDSGNISDQIESTMFRLKGLSKGVQATVKVKNAECQRDLLKSEPRGITY